MTPNQRSSQRRGGLGDLLSNPVPPAGEEDDYTPPQEPAPRPGRPAAQPPSLADRGTPAILPRTRAKRIPKDKLTVQIPSVVLDALTELTDRDSTRKYDEVEEALRAHLAAKGVPIEEV